MTEVRQAAAAVRERLRRSGYIATETIRCRECGAEHVYRRGLGRAPAWCSDECRREAERRRKRKAKAEASLAGCRHDLEVRQWGHVTRLRCRLCGLTAQASEVWL